MVDNWVYKDINYERPDMNKVSQKLEALSQKLQKSKTYDEFKLNYLEYEEILKKVRSQAVLVQLHSWCDLTNTFYQNEFAEFVATVDSKIVPKSIGKAVLNSNFIEEFKMEFGQYAISQLQEGLKEVDDEHLIIEDQNLQYQYQNIIQGLTYFFQDKEMNINEIKQIPQNNPVERREYKKAIYKGYLCKKDEIFSIFKKIVKIRNKRARLNGYENYINLGNNLWGRKEYGEEEMNNLSFHIVKYLRPLYEEVIHWQKETMNLDKVSIADKDCIFSDGEPKHGDLLSGCDAMFHDFSKETGDYFDLLIKHKCIDLEPSPVKMPGVCFQNYINTLGIAPIFAQDNNKPNDVFTLIHEFAHSFQEYRSGLCNKSAFDIIPPIDVSEIASRTMEFFNYKYADKFFGEDATKWRYYHGSNVLFYIMMFASDNEFENYIYTHEDASLEELSKKYCDILKKYYPYDYSDFQEEIDQGALLLQFDTFISLSKYTIGYIPAYLNGLELAFTIDNPVDKYIDLCDYLGHRSYKDTIETIGLHNGFSEDAVIMAENILRKLLKENRPL